MAELGADSRRYHQEVGRLLEEQGIDHVIAVGELARAYGSDDWVPGPEEAAERVARLIRPGDVVLIKGSRSVGLERVAENLLG